MVVTMEAHIEGWEGDAPPKLAALWKGSAKTTALISLFFATQNLRS